MKLPVPTTLHPRRPGASPVLPPPAAAYPSRGRSAAAHLWSISSPTRSRRNRGGRAAAAVHPWVAARTRPVGWLSSTRRAWLAFTLTLLATTWFFVALYVGGAENRRAVRRVSVDCVPAIIAAQRVRAVLSDLDTHLVNQVLTTRSTQETSGGPAPAPEQQSSEDIVVARRRELAEGFVKAASNLTFGEAERVPVVTLVRDLGAYELRMVRLAQLTEGGAPVQANGPLRAATDLMRQSLLPATTGIDLVNSIYLDQTYDTERRQTARWRTGALAGGSVLLGLLLATQVYLVWHTRRLCHPGLLAATAVVVGCLGLSLNRLAEVDRTLRVMKDDRFGAMHELLRARSTLYSAHSDESRWLLTTDPGLLASSERAFNRQATSLLRLPYGLDLTTAIALARGGKPLQGADGALVEELNRAAGLTEETAVAVNALEAWQEYLAIHARIRQLRMDSKRPQAIALCVGQAPDQSGGAFARLDRAFDQLIELNRQGFEQAVADANRLLVGWEWKHLLGLGLVLLLTSWEVRRRLREYAF